MKHKTREKIVAEYLAGGTTYRKLQAKYGIGYRQIHHWVQRFIGRYTSGNRLVESEKTAGSEEILPKEVKQLQAELRKVKLHNQLLESLLERGKQQYGLDLRKKLGTKQS